MASGCQKIFVNVLKVFCLIEVCGVFFFQVKMVKAQPYYYSDSNFQLELNLQEIRRELIQMLDDFEATGCFVCNKLKCCCKEQSISTLSELETDSRKSIKSQESTTKTDVEIPEVSIAPPANTLPLWDKEEDISAGTSKSEHLQYREVEDWVRASTPNADKLEEKKTTKEMDNTFTACERKEEKSPDLLNHSWPLPKSNLEKKIDLNTMTGKCVPNNAVETFFKSFRKSQRPLFAGQLIGQNVTSKLATALIKKKLARNKVTYSYF